MPESEQDREHARRHCLSLAARHYENFPVASRLLPKRLRLPVAVIYAFARTADDFADEGELNPAQRHAKLDDYARKLRAIENGEAVADPVFIALADVIEQHALPLSLFHDLLRAFKMDVDKRRYADFDELLGYCRCSANPVGRLLLHLNRAASEQNLRQSDAICTALQLINFWQDLRQDYHESGRIYLPADEMRRFGVGEQHIAQARSDRAMRALMEFQFQRTARLLQQGAPLGRRLSGRFGLELRMIIHGGAGVLDRLRRQKTDLFSRPRLRRADLPRIALRALLRLPV